MLMGVNDNVENGTCIHDMRMMITLNIIVVVVVVVVVVANNCGCCFVVMRCLTYIFSRNFQTFIVRESQIHSIDNDVCVWFHMEESKFR